MKQQFVITQHHPILQEREKVGILNGLTLSMSFFTKIFRGATVCGHNILTEDAFVTQLFGKMGISVRQIVWVRQTAVS
jgi:DNA-directed RNA polymerase subunit H (RpoH/RPB5)